MSDIFRELEEVTVEQYDHHDLPKWLADPVLMVARSPELYQGKEYLVEILSAQVREYDVYAEAAAVSGPTTMKTSNGHCAGWRNSDDSIRKTAGSY
jgi:hypothetical protein